MVNAFVASDLPAALGITHYSIFNSHPKGRRISSNVLHKLAGNKPRRPGPLKVEPAKLAGDIHHLADEVKTRAVASFHRFRRKVVGIDASQRDLRFRISFRTGRTELPLVNPMAE